MKRIIKRVLLGFTFFASSVAFLAFISPQEQKRGSKWDIPSEYKNMNNPYASDSSLDRVGKMLYIKHCKSCHGSYGKGDGPKASRLETFPGNFQEEQLLKQSDGELYYKSIIGRDEMPNYEKKIADEEDRWALINYLRVMSQKGKR